MDVLFTQQDSSGILTITLNRPDKLNALNREVLTSLQAVFLKAATDQTVKGMLITGAGKAFCAGADIRELAACDSKLGYEFACFGQAVFKQLASLGKPSLALINGMALGGGCELSQAATFRMASTEAKFAQPEVKLGVIPGYGGTQRLARLIGKGRALDLCLSGRMIDANTALNWGLVSEVTEPAALMEKGHAFLKQVISMAPLALAAVMEVIEDGYDMPLEEALKFEALHFSRLCATKDKVEGVQAFLEKKAAVFQGS